MSAANLAADSWRDIPGFPVIGGLMGIAFIWVAIRYMLTRKK